MTAPSHHAAPKIGTSPARTCLRCGGGAYAELRAGCPHAFTLEALAPSPLVEVLLAGRYVGIDAQSTVDAIEIDLSRRHVPGEEWRRGRARTNVRLLRAIRSESEASTPRAESLYLASFNGAEPRVMHPTEEGARRLFAERWVWGQAIAALFEWLHAPDGYDIVGGEMLIAVRQCATCRGTGDWGDGRACVDCEDTDAGTPAEPLEYTVKVDTHCHFGARPTQGYVLTCRRPHDHTATILATFESRDDFVRAIEERPSWFVEMPDRERADLLLMLAVDEDDHG